MRWLFDVCVALIVAVVLVAVASYFVMPMANGSVVRELDALRWLFNR